MDKNILIIEDEKLITGTLKKLLQNYGYNVRVANSGKEAIKKVKANKFDLIICDVRMPDMDGIETIKAIRELLEKEGKNLIPEILITGFADEEKHQEAVKLGVVDYIYKPFDNQVLLAAIAKNLNP